MRIFRSSFYSVYTLVHLIKSRIMTLLILDDSFVIATYLTKLFKDGLVPLAIIPFSLLLIPCKLIVHLNLSYNSQLES